MLTVVKMQRIVSDAMLGNEQFFKDDASARFLKSVEPDIEEAKKNGWTIEIPGEWEVDEGEDE